MINPDPDLKITGTGANGSGGAGVKTTTGGKWFAKINSRTNSTYALISNDASFKDAAGKRYEATVTLP